MSIIRKTWMGGGKIDPWDETRGEGYKGEENGNKVGWCSEPVVSTHC